MHAHAYAQIYTHAHVRGCAMMHVLANVSIRAHKYVIVCECRCRYAFVCACVRVWMSSIECRCVGEFAHLHARTSCENNLHWPTCHGRAPNTQSHYTTVAQSNPAGQTRGRAACRRRRCREAQQGTGAIASTSGMATRTQAPMMQAKAKAHLYRA